jgi:Ca2+/H+ antiporter, TMEM165/GDT1 family
MNWKIFASTFLLIFLAELGDKTQLAVMLQSAVHGRWIVFLAACVALVLSTLLGVVFGGLIAKVVSERVIHAAGGLLFLVFGAMMLYSVFKPGPDIAPIIRAVEQDVPVDTSSGEANNSK